MKFVKVTVDGKEYYEKIENNENIAADATVIEAEFVEKDEKNKAEASESSETDENTASAEEGEAPARFGENVKKFCDKLGRDAGVLMNDVVERSKAMFDNVSTFFNQQSSNPKSKCAKVLKMMPYMDEDDIHEVLEELMNDSDAIRELDVQAMLPFLSAKDCDALFLIAIEAGNKKLVPSEIVPFVSRECLTAVVDGYIDGRYANIDIDTFYPYLSSADVKRIFYHTVSKKQ
ncbi:MAG: hypothetical protein IJY65_01390 [Clostridia bacterium]|nr:hypothetical protein [Clostridia bacterium]